MIVPRERAAYLKEIEHCLRAIDPACEVQYMAHLGDGNTHYSCHTKDEPHLPALRAEIDALAIRMNDRFSAEHGVGLTKLSAMARDKDPVAQDVIRAIKTALDPKGLLNPGKTLAQCADPFGGLQAMPFL
ncbi:MAG: hypothetical protein OQK05_11045 [Pseudopelagicola sp.]|nr:hypothetical protein [Pseudopelagicola sp.]